MTKEDFLAELGGLVRASEPLTPDTCLYDLDGWDSGAMLEVITLVDDNFDIALGAPDFKTFENVSDILTRIGL